MAKSFESSGSPKKGRVLEFLKKFNKVSAVVLASAGIVLGEPVLLGLAAIDVAQAYGINRFQEWRTKRKSSSKGLGSSALGGAKLKPA